MATSANIRAAQGNFMAAQYTLFGNCRSTGRGECSNGTAWKPAFAWKPLPLCGSGNHLHDPVTRTAHVLYAGQIGQLTGSGTMRCTSTRQCLFRRIRTQKSRNDLFGHRSSRELADSAIQDGGREERMLHAQITRLAIEDLPHELHALRRESLRIPKPDDQQPVRCKASFWWTDHQRLPQLATKYLRL